MPTIPLLKPNLELAMPQVPALDRVRRPQIDVRGVIDAMGDLGRASQMPGINAEPFVEAAGAKGEGIGRGLRSIGGAMDILGEKTLEAVGRERLHRQEQEIQATAQQQALKMRSATDPNRAAMEGNQAWNKVEAKAAPKNATPEQQALIDRRRTNGVAQGRTVLDLLKEDRQITLADEALVSSRETAFGLGDFHTVLNLELEREIYGKGDMEHMMERTQKAQRVSLLDADPRQFRTLMGLPEEERPDFMRDIPQVEAQVQGLNVDTAIAWKHAEVAGSISADIDSGVLASSRELAFKLDQGKYDPTGELSHADVAALMRKFQGTAINEPGGFVKMLARVSNFDHATEGERAEANLKSEILLNFTDDYEEHLLSKLEQQVKGTRGVAAMDSLQRVRGTIHEDIVTNLDEGYFGSWKMSANEVFEDAKTGRLMRKALPGERGDQVVKLSESDAAAYQKAKAAGGDALDQMVVDDLTLKSRAERHAMGVMQSLENGFGSRKFTDVQQLTERYKQEMGVVGMTAKGAVTGKDVGGVLHSIRDNLGKAIKTGKLRMTEDATDRAAKELIGSEGEVPKHADAQGLVDVEGSLAHQTELKLSERAARMPLPGTMSLEEYNSRAADFRERFEAHQKEVDAFNAPLNRLVNEIKVKNGASPIVQREDGTQVISPKVGPEDRERLSAAIAEARVKGRV